MKYFRQNNYTEKAPILYSFNLVYILSLVGLWQYNVLYWPLAGIMWRNRTPFGTKEVNKYGSVCFYYRSFFHGTLHMRARIDEEHNQKEKKIIKHYPMTDRLIVTRGYNKTIKYFIGFSNTWINYRVEDLSATVEMKNSNKIAVPLIST